VSAEDLRVARQFLAALAAATIGDHDGLYPLLARRGGADAAVIPSTFG
jgi:hypothetical protein